MVHMYISTDTFCKVSVKLIFLVVLELPWAGPLTDSSSSDGFGQEQKF